jgi:hypothetical protein
LTRDVVKSTIPSRPLPACGEAQPTVVHRDPLTLHRAPVRAGARPRGPPTAKTPNQSTQGQKDGVDKINAVRPTRSQDHPPNSDARPREAVRRSYAAPPSNRSDHR